MIASFGNKLARDLVEDKTSKETRRFSGDLRRTARRKLFLLVTAMSVDDLQAPPGNRIERLKGARKGFWSIRVNDQWRIVFQFVQGKATNVSVEDYH